MFGLQGFEGGSGLGLRAVIFRTQGLETERNVCSRYLQARVWGLEFQFSGRAKDGQQRAFRYTTSG